jgi:hypothetical protein
VKEHHEVDACFGREKGEKGKGVSRNLQEKENQTEFLSREHGIHHQGLLDMIRPKIWIS